MRELELRLALVCFGGASLAVYMNGVSHEILKLVRASKVFHGLNASDKANPASCYANAAPDRIYDCDTEHHYFDLLKAIGETVDLRVIVDVVSGASAGGINGIFLARALAYDLDFSPLRKMWLELGDIEELMEQETLADKWSKLYMHPLIWALGDRIWQGEEPTAEAKRKLSRFLRSRWFQPPFSGERMLEWMLDANRNMGVANPKHSLMPVGHQLDLFVSLTNFYGEQHTVTLHDPKSISEQQHKVSLTFSHRRPSIDVAHSDFGDGNIPGLGFAARATSSFPGAFPPVRLNDLKDYLKQTNTTWPFEQTFHDKNFANLDSNNDDVNDMCFIDGGVTNNKPFADAIETIQDRAAHREVDRRIVFVDPRPDETATETPTEDTIEQKPLPGFFKTILSALADIPRNEPILEDLKAIEAQNKETRRFEAVMKRVDRDVTALVDKIIVIERGREISTAMLSSWRERAHEEAHAQAGFGYGSYIEAKGVQVMQSLCDCIILARKNTSNDEGKTSVYGVLTGWAASQQYFGGHDPGDRNAIPFFRQFDVDYRVRRLRFLIKQINLQAKLNRNTEISPILKDIKARVYKSIALYRARWQPVFYKDITWDAPIEDLMNNISREMGLEDIDYVEDEALAKSISSIGDKEIQVALFRAYVGFAFYDVLTLPMTAKNDLHELDEVRVDRISPLDFTDTTGQSQGNALMGTQLFNFGAFFSRKARENDYIWGRVHAANRLVDFVLDAAGPDAVLGKIDVADIRKKLVASIIETEANHTHHSEELLERLRNDFKL
ncbi:patatin-like protein [Kordiimonas aquimaris]|uniref:patatin-like protein n=1 Tax=Kordiimonas aquimaris TaxID=707591 RepID=UPI0021CE84BB|nr:patatin-like protein [Kordiimonas aquimaris]